MGSGIFLLIGRRADLLRTLNASHTCTAPPATKNSLGSRDRGVPALHLSPERGAQATAKASSAGLVAGAPVRMTCASVRDGEEFETLAQNPTRLLPVDAASVELRALQDALDSHGKGVTLSGPRGDLVLETGIGDVAGGVAEQGERGNLQGALGERTEWSVVRLPCYAV